MNFSQLHPGQRISFTTNSMLYRDIYETEIMGVFPDRIDLKISLHKGYLLLIPTGTVIRWLFSTENRNEFTSVVLSRSIPHHIWSVTRPQVNSHSNSRVVTVSSGKGGVGKTTFSINFSLALQHLQQRVTLLDADIGTANIEILLGMSTVGNLTHVIDGECSLRDILAIGPNGLQVLAGSSGMSSLTNLTPLQFNRIFSGFLDLQDISDFLIIDTGAGISDLVLNFIEASDDFILLTTPEPHALMDAYALLKALTQRTKHITPKLVINNCESHREGIKSRDTISKAAQQFLGIEPLWLGWLPTEKQISKSLKLQKPIFMTHPHSEYSQGILEIAKNFVLPEARKEESVGILSFLKKLKGYALG